MKKNLLNKEELLQLRLAGFTYDVIACKAGVSRQRIQQILSPPAQIRKFIRKKYQDKCADCGIFVGSSGHIHHKDDHDEDYNDIDNLELLCISCHRRKHYYTNPPDIERQTKIYDYYTNHPGITYHELGIKFGFTRQRAHQIIQKIKLSRVLTNR